MTHIPSICEQANEGPEVKGERELRLSQTENSQITSESLRNDCDEYLARRKTWLDTISRKFSIFPIVEAKPPPPPEKPAEMKASDLPIYNSPHTDYKDYLDKKILCPDVNVKLVHKAIMPCVSDTRKTAQSIGGMFMKEIRDTQKEGSDFINGKDRELKKYLRDPNNLQVAQALVAAGGLTGFILGYKRGIPGKFFLTGLGLLSTGSLAFPEETDKYFREFCYHSAKAVIAFYNSLCKKHFSMRERLPCKDEMPTIPPRKKKNPCPPKKK